MKKQLTTLSPDVRAEIEKRLPDVCQSTGVSIQRLRIMIAGMTDSAVEEGGADGLTPEAEAEFLIHISLRVLQQFRGLDV